MGSPLRGSMNARPEPAYWRGALVLALVVAGTSCMRMGLNGVGGDESFGCPEPTLASSVVLPGRPAAGSTVAVAVADDGIALAWVGQSAGTDEVFFMTTDPDGHPHGDQLMVSPDDSSASWAPSVEAVGDSYIVAYADFRGAMPQAYLRVVSASGLGAETRLPDVETYEDHWSVDVAGGEEGLAAAWHDGHDVFFAPVDESGARAGGVTQLTNDPWILEPLDMAYGGGAYGIVWNDIREDYDVYFGLVTRGGEKLVAPLTIAPAPGESISPSICFDGVGFVVLWIDDREGSKALTMARLDFSGDVVFGPVVVASELEPARARVYCNGVDYGVAWLGGGTLYLTTVDESFEAVTSDVRISDEGTVVGDFSIAWRGGDYVAVTVAGADEETSSLALQTIACRP